MRAIITLAKTLNLDVTSEGIETGEHLLRLQALGCDRGQGYLFSPPLTGAAMTALLAKPNAACDESGDAWTDQRLAA